MIIDFNRYNGGGGSGSGVTPQEVQAQIDSALTPYWESGETKDYVDGAVSGISLEGYWNSGETKDYVDNAVADKLDSEDGRVISTALNELHEGLMEVSGRSTPDMSLYTPTSGFSTINGSAITNGGNIVIQGGGGGDMSNYWNSAETKTYVDSAATILQNQIDTIDNVIPAAILDLNQKKVESQDVRYIVKLTQAEYDQLVLDDDVDPDTFYIIVNSN